MQGLVDAMKGRVKKSQVQRVLDVLLNENFLIMKSYNNKVYLVNQDNFEKVEESHINCLDQEIHSSGNEIEELRAQIKKLGLDLKGLKEEISNEELERRLNQYSKEIGSLDGELKKIKSLKIQDIPKEKVEKAEKSYADAKRYYTTNKKVCRDIIDSLCENLEISRKEFFSLACLEEEDELIQNLKISLKNN